MFLQAAFQDVPRRRVEKTALKGRRIHKNKNFQDLCVISKWG